MMRDDIHKVLLPESNKVHEQNPAADKILEESMRYCGCMSPVLVRKINNDQYLVVDGVRRVKVAKKLGMKKLPIHLLTNEDFKVYEAKGKRSAENDCSDSDDEKSVEVKAEYASWTVNLTKGKINHEELTSIVKRLREKGLGYGAIAQRIGYSRSGVKKFLSLLKMALAKRQTLRNRKKLGELRL